MANNNSESSSGGIGCSLALMTTVLFIILKLVGVISWPWWLVLSPVPVLILLVIAIYAIIALLALLGFGAVAGVVGIGHFAQKLANRNKKSRFDNESLPESARPLGLFDATGKRVKEHKPHSWMF